MKTFMISATILAASQCNPEPPPRPVKSAPDAGVTTIDVGELGEPTTTWIDPGPPPFDVPTRPLTLEGLDTTIVAPFGATARTLPGGTVQVTLGEGKNYELAIREASVELDELVSGLEAEAVERLDDAVIWRSGAHWFFHHQGRLACSNPTRSQHDRGDIDTMLASCRTLQVAQGEGQ